MPASTKQHSSKKVNIQLTSWPRLAMQLLGESMLVLIHSLPLASAMLSRPSLPFTSSKAL